VILERAENNWNSRTAKAFRDDRIPKTRQTNEIDWKMDTEVVISNVGLGFPS
jgi:hypothetical protein